MVPLFKNVTERPAAKNYHPVSFLSVASKVFEKLVNNKIVDIFSDFQYGLGFLDQLRSSHSCT